MFTYVNVPILIFWVAGSSAITNAALVDIMPRISGPWASSEGFHGTCCIQVCYVAFRPAYTPSQKISENAGESAYATVHVYRSCCDGASHPDR